jgi:phage tail-like protein
MRKLFATVQGTGTRAKAENFRAEIEIEVLSHPIPGSGGNNTQLTSDNYKDHVAMRFQVYNAWPTSVAYSDLNAGDNAIFVEQLTLVHEGFDVNWAPDVNTSAPEFDK